MTLHLTPPARALAVELTEQTLDMLAALPNPPPLHLSLKLQARWFWSEYLRAEEEQPEPLRILFRYDGLIPDWCITPAAVAATALLDLGGPALWERIAHSRGTDLSQWTESDRKHLFKEVSTDIQLHIGYLWLHEMPAPSQEGRMRLSCAHAYLDWLSRQPLPERKDFLLPEAVSLELHGINYLQGSYLKEFEGPGPDAYIRMASAWNRAMRGPCTSEAYSLEIRMRALTRWHACALAHGLTQSPQANGQLAEKLLRATQTALDLPDESARYAVLQAVQAHLERFPQEFEKYNMSPDEDYPQRLRRVQEASRLTSALLLAQAPGMQESMSVMRRAAPAAPAAPVQRLRR